MMAVAQVEHADALVLLELEAFPLRSGIMSLSLPASIVSATS